MKTPLTLSIIGLCFISLSVYGKERSHIKASKILKGKVFSIDLDVITFNKTTDAPPDHPFGFAKKYTDRMKLTYGSKEISMDDTRDTYTNLFDPKRIEAIGVVANGQLVYEIEGGDRAHSYRYRFYVDPVTYNLVRKLSLKSNNSFQPPIDQNWRNDPRLVKK
jgi:hypothetical protein